MTTFVIANFINPCNYITNDDSTHYICTQIEQNLDCHIDNLEERPRRCWNLRSLVS